MAYAASVTITGKAGPGLTVTAQTYTGVTDVAFNVSRSEVTLVLSSGAILTIAVATTLTVTVTVSSGNYTVTIA